MTLSGEGDDGNEFLLYLGPSYAELKKGGALKNILSDSNLITFLILKDIKKDGTIEIPKYHFETIENVGSENIDL